MNAIAGNGAGGRNMMALVAFQGVRIVDSQDLLVIIRDDHVLCPLAEAFLHATSMTIAGSFRATLRITDLSVNRCGIGG